MWADFGSLIMFSVTGSFSHKAICQFSMFTKGPLWVRCGPSAALPRWSALGGEADENRGKADIRKRAPNDEAMRLKKFNSEGPNSEVDHLFSSGAESGKAFCPDRARARSMSI